MGKIADRLRRRKAPEFELVRRIVKAAALAAADLDTDVDGGGDGDGDGGGDAAYGDLYVLIAGALAEMSPAQFHELIGQVYDEADPRPDADDLLELVVSCVQELVEVVQHEDGSAHYLMALPVCITHGELGSRVTLSPAQIQAAARALQGNALVLEDADVTVLPQLLAPAKADYLREGTTYAMTRALASGQLDRAARLVSDDLEAQGLTGTGATNVTGAADGPLTSFAVLVAVVRCSDEEPFPLDMLLDQAIHEGTADDASTADAAIEEALADVAKVLERCSSELTSAMGVAQVAVLEAPSGWYHGVETACLHERRAGAIAAIEHLATAHTQGDVGLLQCDEYAARREGAVYVADVYRRGGDAPVGRIQWQFMVRETPQECLDDLSDMLEQQGVGSIGGARPGAADLARN